MKKLLGKIALSILLLLAVVYAGDYLVLRFKIATKREAFGNVTVYHYYAIGEKGNKTEYVPIDTQPVTCVRALFPHLGDAPCWYLTRHPQKQTDI